MENRNLDCRIWLLTPFIARRGGAYRKYTEQKIAINILTRLLNTTYV